MCACFCILTVIVNVAFFNNSTLISPVYMPGSVSARFAGCFLVTRFVYLHAAKWLLAVLVNTSGWHLEPGNQAMGKLGGSALNVLLKIIPKLSMNYPPELLHSCLALSIDGTGRGRVLDSEV